MPAPSWSSGLIHHSLPLPHYIEGELFLLQRSTLLKGVCTSSNQVMLSQITSLIQLKCLILQKGLFSSSQFTTFTAYKQFITQPHCSVIGLLSHRPDNPLGDCESRGHDFIIFISQVPSSANAHPFSHLLSQSNIK